jgi:hypothetical protein
MRPTLNGLSIFGQANSAASERRHDYSLSSQFGVDGVGHMDAGGRGSITTVTGILSGAGPAGLIAAEAAVRSYHDGQAYPFTDTLGNAWPQTMLIGFRPTSRVRQTPDGTFSRSFEAQLRHLP